MSDDYESFGELIRKYRLRAGYRSQVEFARRLRWLPSKLSRAERPELPPTRAVALAIITALNDELNFNSSQLAQLAQTYLLPPALRAAPRPERLIGLILPNIDESSFFSTVAGAIEQYAGDAGYRVVLCQHRDDIHRELHQLEFFTSVPVAAVIAAPATGISEDSDQHAWNRGDLIRELRHLGVPTLFFDRRGAVAGQPVPFIGLDNRTAVRTALEYLARRHHRRVGAILDRQHVSHHRERAIGFRESISSLDLETRDEWVKIGWEVAEGEREDDRLRHGFRHGRLLARELLDLPADQRPTAVFCGSYHFALDLIHVIRERDPDGTTAAIGRELSIIGIDDVPELDLTTPPITRVQYDLNVFGRGVVEMLFDILDDPKTQVADRFVGKRVGSIEIAERGSVATLVPS